MSVPVYDITVHVSAKITLKRRFWGAPVDELAERACSDAEGFIEGLLEDYPSLEVEAIGYEVDRAPEES